MATVFLARDLKHDRDVALKVLRPELFTALAHERFLAEIRLTAKLDHPHILTLIDSGESGGSLWYVVPFIRGESLRRKLEKEKQLGIEEVLAIGKQLASALDYAHRQGVIHRDIKPENILLHEGEAMLADFGIALAVTQAGGSRLTETGLSLGTPMYMSPEQATGDRELDGRSDVYSLAVVLYEMLAGEPPHAGATARAVLAKLMTTEPVRLRTLRPALPTAIENAIHSGLAKVREDRCPTAGAIFEALQRHQPAWHDQTGPEHAEQRSGPPLTILQGLPAKRSKVSRIVVVAGGVGTIAGILGLYSHFRSQPGQAPASRQSQLTFVGNAAQQAISPDGQLLAYVERGESLRVLVKDLAGGSLIPIATFQRNIMTLRWSPDGTMILCSGEISGHRPPLALWPRLGGFPRRLPDAMYATMSVDGSQVATWNPSAEFGIVLQIIATGARRPISAPDTIGWLRRGDWSPNGRWLVVPSAPKAGGRWNLWMIDVESGKWHTMLSDTVELSAPHWAPRGDALYYLNGGNELRKLRIGSDGLVRGAPEVLQTGLSATDISITADGTRLAYTKNQAHSNLWVATRRRGTSQFIVRQVTTGTAEKSRGALSPDGRLIAFLQREERGAGLFVLPVEGGLPQRISTDEIAGAIPPGSDGPAWSPDGRRLAFVATAPGGTRVHTITLEGQEQRTYSTTDAAEWAHISWAPHQRLLYQARGNANFRWLDLETESEEPLVPNDSLGWLFQASASSDLSHVAAFWNREPTRGTYVISLHDGSQTQMGPDDSWPLGWSADGTLFVQDNSGRIHHIPVLGKESEVFRNPIEGEEAGDCNLSERTMGLVLVCNVEEPNSDAWMITNFDPEAR
jgi:serine/threonine-protein kinase